MHRAVAKQRAHGPADALGDFDAAIALGEALREAALAGAGLAYLATWLAAPDLRAGRLEAVLTTTGAEDMPIHVLWPRVRDVTPKVRVVVDELVLRFLPTPPWNREHRYPPGRPFSGI